MSMDTGNGPNPAQAVRNARIVWAALIAGQVIFLAVVLGLGGRSATGIDDAMRQNLGYVAIALTATAVAAGWFLRRTILGPDRPVLPNKYVGATIASLAVMEGAVLATLVLAMISGSAMPFIAIAAGGLTAQIVQFPRGTELDAA